MADNLQNKLLSLLLGGDDDAEIEKLKKALAAAIIRSEQHPDPKIDIEEHKSLLAKSFGLFQQKHKFQVGNFVRWKPGLRNRRYPDDNQPGIILEVIDPPIVETAKDSGSMYFRELLDLRIGVIGTRGEMVSYLFDGRRWEPLP